MDAVGSLRLVLGMDAADFEAGVKRVNGAMDKMAVKFGVMAGIAQEFASQFIARIGNAFQAVGTNIQNAIREADKLGDLAQSIGVNVEALSKLQFAAGQAGVETEQFGVGVVKLSKALQEIAGGGKENPAAKAIAALGVEINGANGKLLPTEEILVRIADKFASFADGANKTALAVNIFGKSGAVLIPFLNQGRDGIAQLSAEADRLGITLTSSAAAALGQTNDNLDKLASRTDAMWRIIASDLSPALLTLTQRWLDDAQAAGGLNVAFAGIAGAVRFVVAEIIKLDGWLRREAIELEELSYAFSDLKTSMLGVFGGDTSEMEARRANALARYTIELQKTDAALKELYRTQLSDPSQGAAAASGLQGFNNDPAKKDAPLIESNERLAESKRLLNEQEQLARKAESEGNAIRKETMTINEQLIATEHQLLQAWATGAINARTYGVAMQQAALVAANAHANAASKIMSNLSGVFGKAKGFAIAQAIINTAEAFTAALKGPPGPPWSYAIAASTLAAGYAQVQNIKNTNPGSGGASGGGAAASSSATAAPVMPQQGLYVNLEGEKFGREQVVGLIDMINQAGRDGYKIEVSK